MTKNRRMVVAAVALLAIAGTALWFGGRSPGDHVHANGADTMTMSAVESTPRPGGAGGLIQLDARTVQALGITTVTAELGTVSRSIRTSGIVTYDETRLGTITPKIGGFVERLHVAFTGQSVRRGQAVLEIYSPELVAAQEDLLAALRLERQLAASAAPGVAERSGALAEAARRRLLLWDISQAQIEELERSERVRRTLTLHAPVAGFVTDKSVQTGQSVQAGDVLYRVADLSRVWVEADVYEQDLRAIRIGQHVDVEVGAFPGEQFPGRVTYIHPDVRLDTRTARVRIELVNPEVRLKPGMFATAHIDAPAETTAVVIPSDAVMRTGARNLVFVDRGPGRFEQREVQIGADGGRVVQVRSGLQPGERVAARANFLLDAESRLTDDMRGNGDAGGSGSMGGMNMPGMNH